MPLDDVELGQTPGHLLRRCHQRSHEIYNAVFPEEKATRQQFATLMAIHRHPGASVQDLADLTAVDRNTLSGIVTRLVSKGLIEKKRSSEDARAYELRVRPAGLQLLEEMADGIARVQEEILAPLDEAERKSFIHCMRKMTGLEG